MTIDTDADLDPPLLRVRGPADLVQAIPYLLGFHAERSLVLLGLAQGRVVVTARMDLADLAESRLLQTSVFSMSRGGADKFVAVLFDDDARPVGVADGATLPWAGAAAEVAETVDAAGGLLDDVLLVCGERLWSYTCTVAACCPPEGRLIEPNTEVAATAAYAGLVALPSRAAVEALLDPADAAHRSRLLPAIVAAEKAAIAGLLAGTAAREDRSVKRAMFAAARTADSPGVEFDLADEQVVRFGAALRSIPMRDAVWMAIDEKRIDGRPLWQQLARRLPAPYDAAPLFLFGWASWRAGEGALAGIAAERAIDSDPAYSAADLLLAALSQVTDPRRLPRLRSRRAG
jgi:hypothetical protein